MDTEEGITYYGVLTDIIELNYYDKLRYVLFKCDWADITQNRGQKKDDFGFTVVNFSHLIHTGKRLNDEPFIFASQARQVYYVEDGKGTDWLTIVKTKPRDVFDIGSAGIGEADDNTYCDSEPYNIDLASLLSDTSDYLSWVRNDVDGTTVNKTLASENLIQEDKYTDSSEFDDDSTSNCSSK